MTDQSDIDKIVMEGIASFQKSDEGSETEKGMEEKTEDPTEDPVDDVTSLPGTTAPDDEVPVNLAEDQAAKKDSSNTAYEQIFKADLQAASVEELQDQLGRLMNVAFGGM